MSSGGMHLSREFFELIKAIGESKSKQEEDRIIAREVTRLKQQMETPAATQSSSNLLVSSKKRAKEFLVRLLYVEMLGHDASFGYIKAVEMAASASLFHKRTGYVVCGACLPPTHEFRFMLVNQMQRDLQSTNVLECSGGIIACTNMITADMVPAVAAEVTKLITHESATIRKKSIIALHRFHQLAPDVVNETELHEHLRKVLCDKDPSVMGASLNVIQAMAYKNNVLYKDLVPSLVSILKQVIEHRLPSDYDYHRVPAPWIQLKLVRILAILGKADANASRGMYEIIHECLKKADNGINAGYAIVYECVKCIIHIYPNNNLLDAAGEAISRFIQSRSHNLRYLGVTGLAFIVEQHPQYAAQHQLAVMDCLEDPDETLQRKTLDLLFRMCNPVNVEFIAEKLLSFLSGTTDLFLKKLLTKRVCVIAERYAPNNAWYIRTITSLFEVAGEMVEPQVAQNLMSLIAEGTGESDEDDMLLRQNAIEIYVALARDKPIGSMPRILLETMAWCLGEYGYLSAACALEEVLQQLCDLARIHKSKLEPRTRRFLVLAIMKLVAQAGTCPPHAAEVIDDYTKSLDYDLQQRCLEFQNLLTTCPQLLPEILPVDASAEDVDVDESLSFLNGYVQDALHDGASPYQKPEDDDDDEEEAYLARGSQPEFKMTPYDKPQHPAQAMRAMAGLGATGRTGTQSVSLPPGAQNAQSNSVPMNLQQGGQMALNTRNVASVWGKGGLKHDTPGPTAAPTPSAIPSSSAWNSQSSAGNAFGGNASSGYGQSGYGGGFSSPAPAPSPVKTAAQIERERQAAALFGGVVPGAVVPAPTSAPVAPPPPPKAAPPAKPATPASDIDLLDMGAWDAPSVAPTPSSGPSGSHDVHPEAPQHTAISESATAVVETIDDEDGDDEPQYELQQEESLPPPVADAVKHDDDPFASAGLLGDVSQPPLPSLEVNQKFEYNGGTFTPMKITTAQFGQQWVACTSSSPISLVSSKVTSLGQFMDTCSKIGAYPVEAIASTNEGICAGMMGGGSKVALIHGKITPMGSGANIDATIKCSDAGMGSSLAMYLQTMLR